MSKRRVFLGIDFGTSNSSIAYVIPDPRDKKAQKVDVSSVSIDIKEGGGAKSDRLPTILSSSMDNKRSRTIFGWDFFNQFFGKRKKAELLRHGEDFFRSVKSDLGTLRIYPYAFSDDYKTPEKVAGTIIKRLLEEADKYLGNLDVYDAKLVISVPASLSVLGREQTIAAAIHAGVDSKNIELIDEPVAALVDFLNSSRAATILDDEEMKNILIFDYGGGTLDLSMVRARFDNDNKNSGLRVLNSAISQYRRLGGDDIDRAVMVEIVWPQIEAAAGLLREEMDSDLRERLNDTLTPTIARTLKEGICRQISDSFRKGSRDARRLKIIEKLDVSFDEINMPRAFKITSEEFEEVMRPFLSVPDSDDESWDSRSLLRPILEVLDRSGLQSSQLDVIILHGGSCRNPFLRKLLSEHTGDKSCLLGSSIIEETPNLDTSVARGAAISCYWRNERETDLVTPIIGEEIGIVTLDERRVRLIDAGEDLPFPDEDSVHFVEAEFYVPKTNLKQMIVPFYSGDQELLIADVVKVDLPPKVERGTPVAIKLRVDRNKSLHWWCKIGDGEFIPAESVNNPWASEVPSTETKELYDHRRAMRQKLEQSSSIPHEMLLREIVLLYSADHIHDAELLTLDLIRNSGLTASLANRLGLLAHNRSDSKASLGWHQKAAEMNPENAIFVGNYGCQLFVVGRFDEAESVMRSALSIDPELAYIYSWLGDFYRKLGNEEKARAEYSEALRLERLALAKNSDSPERWRTIAGLHRNLGEYDEAAAASARATTLHKNQKLGGDHRTVIAGSDSGIMFSDEVL